MPLSASLPGAPGPKCHHDEHSKGGRHTWSGPSHITLSGAQAAASSAFRRPATARDTVTASCPQAAALSVSSMAPACGRPRRPNLNVERKSEPRRVQGHSTRTRLRTVLVILILCGSLSCRTCTGNQTSMPRDWCRHPLDDHGICLRETRATPLTARRLLSRSTRIYSAESARVR
jgi:hypothetical protein